MRMYYYSQDADTLISHIYLEVYAINLEILLYFN